MGKVGILIPTLSLPKQLKEIPDSVTSIRHSTFSGCTGLTSIKIPNSATSIGNGTFRGCTGLTSIEIPNSVASIGDNAFDEYTRLIFGVCIKVTSEYLNQTQINECCICLNKYEIDDKIITLRCHHTHIFHIDCIKLLTNLRCPLCRIHIDEYYNHFLNYAQEALKK